MLHLVGYTRKYVSRRFYARVTEQNVTKKKITVVSVFSGEERWAPHVLGPLVEASL